MVSILVDKLYLCVAKHPLTRIGQKTDACDDVGPHYQVMIFATHPVRAQKTRIRDAFGPNTKCLAFCIYYVLYYGIYYALSREKTRPEIETVPFCNRDRYFVPQTRSMQSIENLTIEKNSILSIHRRLQWRPNTLSVGCFITCGLRILSP